MVGGVIALAKPTNNLDILRGPDDFPNPENNDEKV